MAQTTSRTDRRTPDLGERIATLEQLFEQEPERNVGKLAEAYLLDGRPQEAIRVLEKHANGRDVDRSVLLAQAWFDTFDIKRCASILETVKGSARVDNNLRAQLLFGELAVEAGQRDEAKKHLQQVRTLDPTHRRAAELLKSLGESVEVPQEEPVDSTFRTTEEKRESGKRAFLHIIIGLILGGALLAGYVWWSQNAHKAKALALKGAQSAENADVNSLRAAEQSYLEALTFQSRNEYAISGLAEIYSLLWVDHGFEDMKPKAMEYLNISKDRDIEKAERFSAELLVAYGEGRHEEAEQIAAKVIERGGVSEKLYFALGLTQRALGKPKLGRDNLRKAYDLKGDAPHYETALGDAYDADDDDRNAVFFWSQAEKHNASYIPGTARSLYARARKGEDVTQLRADLAKLAEMKPGDLGKRDQAGIELARSAILLREGKSKPALAAANKAIELVGEQPRLLTMRGQALLADNKIGPGLKAFEGAHQKSTSSQRYFYGLVDAYTEAGKHELAIKTLKLKAGEFSQTPRYHIKMGEAFRLQQKWERAKEAYEKVLKLDDNNAEANLGLGYIAFKQRKYDDATAHFEKAVSAKPKWPQVYIAVGTMWIEQGYGSQAHTQLEHAEKLHLSQKADRRTMQKFYGKTIKAFQGKRGNNSYVKQWIEREKKYRQALAEQK